MVKIADTKENVLVIDEQLIASLSAANKPHEAKSENSHRDDYEDCNDCCP